MDLDYNGFVCGCEPYRSRAKREKLRADTATRLLYSLCCGLEDNGYGALLLGIGRAELSNWLDRRKTVEKTRARLEAAKKAKLLQSKNKLLRKVEARAAVLAKLSPPEIKALGIHVKRTSQKKRR